MNLRNIIGGTVITLVIGGTAFSVSQTDIVDNFASDTGLSQEQAEQYIDSIEEEDLIDYNELGDIFVEDGTEMLVYVEEIDCMNYEYEWESTTLSCDEGKIQFEKIAIDTIALGEAYRKIDEGQIVKANITNAIELIDVLNSDYNLEFAIKVLDPETLDEERKTNSYNKAVLQAILQSEEGQQLN